MRARLLKPMHRGQLPALRCRHARVDGLQRLSGRLALPQAGTPSPSCRRPGANPRPWTEISMGTRAHTTPIAPTRRPSSAPRSALRAALRVTGHRSWRSHTTRWPSPGHPPNNFTHTSLTRPDCTDKRNGGDRQRSPACRRRGASRDWRGAGRLSLCVSSPAFPTAQAWFRPGSLPDGAKSSYVLQDITAPMFCVRLCSESALREPLSLLSAFWGGESQSIIRGLRGTRAACRSVGICRALFRAERAARSLVL